MAFIYTLIIIDLPNSDGYALKGELKTGPSNTRLKVKTLHAFFGSPFTHAH